MICVSTLTTRPVLSCPARRDFLVRSTLGGETDPSAGVYESIQRSTVHELRPETPRKFIRGCMFNFTRLYSVPGDTKAHGCLQMFCTDLKGNIPKGVSSTPAAEFRANEMKGCQQKLVLCCFRSAAEGNG
jgi:hypothetical protein|eukprot:COSAG01_NODE_5546_length_4192_cov_2.172978_3_plen_130_part_00